MNNSPDSNSSDAIKLRFLESHEQGFPFGIKRPAFVVFYVLIWFAAGLLVLDLRAAVLLAGISATFSLIGIVIDKFWKRPRILCEMDRLRTIVLENSPIESVITFKPALMYRESVKIMPENSDITWRGEVKLPESLASSNLFGKQLSCQVYLDPTNGKPEVIAFEDVFIRLLNVHST